MFLQVSIFPEESESLQVGLKIRSYLCQMQSWYLRNFERYELYNPVALRDALKLIRKKEKRLFLFICMGLDVTMF